MPFPKMKGSKPHRKLFSPIKEGRGRIILNWDYTTHAVSCTGEAAAALKEDTERLQSTEQSVRTLGFKLSGVTFSSSVVSSPMLYYY